VKPLSQYTLEKMLETFKISVRWQTYRKNGADNYGQPKYEVGVSVWVAENGKDTAEGNTPREAVEKLVEKLTA